MYIFLNFCPLLFYIDETNGGIYMATKVSEKEKKRVQKILNRVNSKSKAKQTRVIKFG